MISPFMDPFVKSDVASEQFDKPYETESSAEGGSTELQEPASNEAIRFFVPSSPRFLLSSSQASGARAVRRG